MATPYPQTAQAFAGRSSVSAQGQTDVRATVSAGIKTDVRADVKPGTGLDVRTGTVADMPADVLVLGAGAAGLLCAVTAARQGARVALVDLAARPGRKIAISGGGKCNFTNRRVSVDNYVGMQPDFCTPALRGWQPEDMLAWCAAHGIAWEERDHGRLFGLNSAERLIDALVDDCTQAGVQWHCLCRIEGLTPPFATEEQGTGTVQEAAGLFRAHCVQLDPAGQEVETVYLTAPRVVLALGSPAWAACGATDTGLKLAKALGHGICPLRPVLVPLNMPQDWPLRDLAGISASVEITVDTAAGSTEGTGATGSKGAKGGKADARSFKDALLFTHQGISGPATLLASCHWKTGQILHLNFLPENSFADLLDAPECGKLFVKNLLARHLPQRLAEALIPAELAQRKVAELSRKQRNLLAQCVHDHQVIPTGTAGLRKAEAAAGGVQVADIDPHSLQSRKVPGLYFAGEMLDIAGHLGGYNLHWAFASGILAGKSAGAKSPNAPKPIART